MDAVSTVTSLRNSSDVLFLTLGAVMVFAMHAGFAFRNLPNVWAVVPRYGAARGEIIN